MLHSPPASFAPRPRSFALPSLRTDDWTPDGQRAWLRLRCAETGLTPSALAIAAGVAASTLNRFLRGPSPRSLNLRTVQVIAAVPSKKPTSAPAEAGPAVDQLKPTRPLPAPHPPSPDLVAIFRMLGGPACVGRIIGKSTEHAATMLRRRSVPIRYWPALIGAAASRGQMITEADLVAAHRPPPPDATLLALGDDLEAAWAHEAALLAAEDSARGRPDFDQAAYDLACETANNDVIAIAQRIAAYPAAGLPGIMVKLRALRWLYADEGFDEQGFDDGDATDHALVGSILCALERIDGRPIPSAALSPAAPHTAVAA